MMVPVVNWRVVVIGIILAAPLHGEPTPPAGSGFSKGAQDVVDEATITLMPARCAGVIVGDQGHAITAAHCIGQSMALQVELSDGRRARAAVERLDREHDVAILKLDQQADVTPLRIATVLPALGDALYFGGRRDRKGSAQVFAVLRLGRCPSLPQVDNAIFTNLHARKGDSGAPLVNRSREVVALVHGGAQCNIATPVIGVNVQF